MEPVKDGNKLAGAEPAAVTPPAPAPAAASAGAAPTAGGKENQPAAEKITETPIGERTQIAISTLLETIAETDRPSEDYQLQALKTLKGEDLTKLTDGARAKLILDTAKKLKAIDDAANEPKDALKNAVKAPGSDHKPPVDDLEARFKSKDPKVSLKAAKEKALNNLLNTLPPEKVKALGFEKK